MASALIADAPDLLGQRQPPLVGTRRREVGPEHDGDVGPGAALPDGRLGRRRSEPERVGRPGDPFPLVAGDDRGSDGLGQAPHRRAAVVADGATTGVDEGALGGGEGRRQRGEGGVLVAVVGDGEIGRVAGPRRRSDWGRTGAGPGRFVPPSGGQDERHRAGGPARGQVPGLVHGGVDRVVDGGDDRTAGQPEDLRLGRSLMDRAGEPGAGESGAGDLGREVQERHRRPGGIGQGGGGVERSGAGGRQHDPGPPGGPGEADRHVGRAELGAGGHEIDGAAALEGAQQRHGVGAADPEDGGPPDPGQGGGGGIADRDRPARRRAQGPRAHRPVAASMAARTSLNRALTASLAMVASTPAEKQQPG